MSTNPTQHDPRAVEALAKQAYAMFWSPNHNAKWDETGEEWRNAARGVARFVLDREAALVAALERLCKSVIEGPHAPGEGCPVCIEYAKTGRTVLAAHRAPQPSEPTLAEAVDAMLTSAPQVVYGTEPKTAVPLDADGVRLCVVRPAALDAVRQALARERSRGGGK